MALVGEAYVIVKAITRGVEDDIKKVFNSPSLRRSAEMSGKSTGKSFSDALSRGASGGPNALQKLSDSIGAIAPNGQAAVATLRGLIATSNFLLPIIVLLSGAIGALVGGLIALAGAVGGAAIAGIVSLGGAFGALLIGVKVATTALSGVGKAVSAYFKQQNDSSKKAAETAKALAEAQKRLALAQESALERLVDANKRVERAQRSYTDAIREGSEELQQLSFDAEDAAIAEKRAAVELEKARETLVRSADLPPNSRVRREAELAFQEADLNLRRAKDRVVDLNKEQNRLADQGNMTDGELAALEELNEANKGLAKTQRDNARSIIQAEQEIEDAKNKSRGQASNEDPFAGLTESQRDFAKFLVDLVPKYKNLKEVVAAGFLPILEEQIKRLDKTYFPILNSRLGAISKEVGNASKEITDKLLDPDTVTAFDKALQQLGVEGGPISKIGSIAGTTGQILIEMFDASLPYADDFLGKIDENLEKFREFLREARESGAFQDFMTRATPALDTLGSILINTFGSIGTIINANIGPGSGGQKLLDALDTSLKGFANMSDTDFTELQTTFSDLADTFLVLAGLIGDILGIFTNLAKNPEVKDFFQQMRDEAIPILEGMADKVAGAAGGFGDLIIELLKFTDIFLDTGGIDAFFGTLTAFIQPLNDFLAGDAAARILDIAGKITGVLTALFFLGKGGEFAFNIAAGAAQNLTGFIGGTQAVFSDLRGSFKAFGETMDLQKVLAQMGGVDASALTLKDKFTDLRIGGNGAFDALSNSSNGFLQVVGNVGKAVMANPILLVIGLIIGALAILYANSEEFRLMVDNLIKFVMDIFNEALAILKPIFDALGEAVGELTAAFGGDGSGLLPIMDLVIEVLKFIINYIVYLGTVIASILLPIITVLIKVWTGVVTVVNAVIKTIAAFVEALFTGDWKKFQQLFEAIWAEVGIMLFKLFVDIQNAFINMINSLVKAALNFVKNSPFAGLVNTLLEAASTFFGGKKITLDAAIKLADKGLITKVEYPPAVKQMQAKAAAAGSDVRLTNKKPVTSSTKDINVAALTSTSALPNIGSALSSASKTTAPALAIDERRRAQAMAQIAKLNSQGKTKEAEALSVQVKNSLMKSQAQAASTSGSGGVTLNSTTPYSNYPSAMTPAASSNPVTINVYPSEGMDEREIASIVSREIALQLRKGALV